MKTFFARYRDCGAAVWRCAVFHWLHGSRGMKVWFLLSRQPCADLASVGGVGRAVFGCLCAVVTRVERVPFYSCVRAGSAWDD